MSPFTSFYTHTHQLLISYKAPTKNHLKRERKREGCWAGVSVSVSFFNTPHTHTHTHTESIPRESKREGERALRPFEKAEKLEIFCILVGWLLTPFHF